MKVDIKISRQAGWTQDHGFDWIETDDIIDIDDSIFNNIVNKKQSVKNVVLWYATLDGNIVVNHKGKSTWKSEKLLRQGIKYVLDRYINPSYLNIKHDFNTRITIDLDKLIDDLLNSGRLVFRSNTFKTID